MILAGLAISCGMFVLGFVVATWFWLEAMKRVRPDLWSEAMAKVRERDLERGRQP